MPELAHLDRKTDPDTIWARLDPSLGDHCLGANDDDLNTAQLICIGPGETARLLRRGSPADHVSRDGKGPPRARAKADRLPLLRATSGRTARARGLRRRSAASGRLSPGVDF